MPQKLPHSRWVDLDGPVHYVDFGGPPGGPLLVCVHGLGGSHVNWLALAPLLTDRCRVVALDLAGFGLTRGSGRQTTVLGNRTLLHRFLTEVTGTPAVLVGNSMGGLVSVLQVTAAPQTVAGTVLVDPVLPVHVRSGLDRLTAAAFVSMAVPGAGRWLGLGPTPRTPQEHAARTLRLCCADPSRVPAAVLQAHIDLALSRRWYPEIEQEFLAAAKSVVRHFGSPRRYPAMLRAVPGAVLLLHGEKDRLVPIGAARAAARRNPHWRFEPAADVGHVPQLEAPRWVADQLLDWLGREGAGAAEAAGGAAAPAESAAS